MSRHEKFVDLITDCNKELLCFGVHDNHQPIHPANRNWVLNLYACKMIHCNGSKNGNIYL